MRRGRAEDGKAAIESDALGSRGELVESSSRLHAVEPSTQTKASPTRQCAHVSLILNVSTKDELSKAFLRPKKVYIRCCRPRARLFRRLRFEEWRTVKYSGVRRARLYLLRARRSSAGFGSERLKSGK